MYHLDRDLDVCRCVEEGYFMSCIITFKKNFSNNNIYLLVFKKKERYFIKMDLGDISI